MRIDFSHNYAEVSKRDNGTFFVKISFPEVGLYVHGIRVVPSKQDEDKFVVYQPKIRALSGGWKTNYEHTKSGELLMYLKELALKAVDQYDVTNFDDIDDIDIDKELGKAIDDLQGKPP